MATLHAVTEEMLLRGDFESGTRVIAIITTTQREPFMILGFKRIQGVPVLLCVNNTNNIVAVALDTHRELDGSWLSLARRGQLLMKQPTDEERALAMELLQQRNVGGDVGGTGSHGSYAGGRHGYRGRGRGQGRGRGRGGRGGRGGVRRTPVRR